jgi:ribosomal protein S18 acetylase RimI-like enzyme
MKITAANPIPLDKAKIKTLNEKIVSSLFEVLQTLPVDKPIRTQFLVRETFKLNNLKNEPMNIEIAIVGKIGNNSKFEKILGGTCAILRTVDRKLYGADIEVFLNGNLFPTDFSKSITTDVYNTLIHEITHAIDPAKDQRIPENLNDYYNTPVEINAYIQNILEELETKVEAIVDKNTSYSNQIPKTDKREVLKDLLMDSKFWNKGKNYWNQQAKQKIFQAVYKLIDQYTDTSTSNKTAALKLEHRYHGYHDQQSDESIIAFIDGEMAGFLDYSEFQKQPAVKMIEVKKEFQRKGIATELLKELDKLYPNTEIDYGYSTTEGSELIKSYIKRFPKKLDFEKGFSNKDFVMSFLPGGKNGKNIDWWEMCSIFSNTSMDIDNYDLTYPPSFKQFTKDLNKITTEEWKKAAKELRERVGITVNSEMKASSNKEVRGKQHVSSSPDAIFTGTAKELIYIAKSLIS